MINASPVASADVRLRNGMPAFPHSLSNTAHRQFHIGQPEVMQFNFVARLPRFREVSNIGLAAQSAFHPERLSRLNASSHLFEHQSPSLQCDCLRGKWGQPAGNLISVQKPCIGILIGQVGSRKSRFPCAIASAEEVNDRLTHGSSTPVERFAASAEQPKAVSSKLRSPSVAPLDFKARSVEGSRGI